MKKIIGFAVSVILTVFALSVGESQTHSQAFLELLASAAVSAIGAAASGASAESERRRRFREYLNTLEKNKREELTQTINLVGGQIAGMRQSAIASGSRRAAAMGRTADKESIIAPIETRAQTVGSRALREAVGAVNTGYRNAVNAATADFENRPIQPSVGDFLQTLGEAGTEYFLGRGQINSALDTGVRPPEVPKLSPTPKSPYKLRLPNATLRPIGG